MSTPEGRVKAAIKVVLKRVGMYYHMPVQNGMGAPSLDFVGCLRGRFIAIEAKAPGEKPTKRQTQTRNEMAAAGAVVFLVRSVEEAWELETTLNLMVPL